jgi:tripartite-type tricarboxylate transporter receptor subunit TctC
MQDGNMSAAAIKTILAKTPGKDRVKRFVVMAIVIASSISAAVLAQPYPSKPIRLMVPSSPGGGTDITARIIAPRMSEGLRQPVVVENRAGAGTMIGTEVVARAAPDGYTLLLASTPLAINPAMYAKVPYDALRDFAAVTQVVSLPNLLVSHPSLPVRTVAELLAFAKPRPGQLTYASAGAGTSPHLAMARLIGMSGLKMTHVPYKGAGPGIIDVIAGQISLMTPSIITVLNYVKDGRLRALGVTSAQRASCAPDIPTVAEGGVPGYEASQWFGVLAPAGTSREIVNLLRAEIVRVLQLPGVRARLSSDGTEPVGSTPEAFAAYIRAETAKWTKVVKDSSIRAD